MNRLDRVKMVKAMEFIARQINDENVFEGWIMEGVVYVDLGATSADCADELPYLECYIEDRSFADLMDAFLWCMQRAYKSGGLHCDGIVSRPAD